MHTYVGMEIPSRYVYMKAWSKRVSKYDPFYVKKEKYTHTHTKTGEIKLIYVLIFRHMYNIFLEEI